MGGKPPGRPVAGFAAVAVLALLGVLTVAADGPSGSPGAGPTVPVGESASASPSPYLLRECWVPTPAGNVALRAEDAQALTTAAAKATDRRRAGRQLQSRVARLLDAEAVGYARAVTAAVLGDPHTERLTCAYTRLDADPQQPGRDGLTPRARRLRAAWIPVFGPLVAGGFAARGVSSGHVDGSAHYEGRAIDVFFRPYDDPGQRRLGRLFAQWLVAHAQTYQVLSVIYADQIWTSWAPYWREYVHPSGNRRDPVLRHLDHVHVAVESGRPWRGR